ncbi:MAG TPA: protein kinase [Polyangiaceae bacterium]|nr:protein kinase [Polyangiaceae bacterium]
MRRAELRVGTVLRGKYRIDRILGIGGMATVYAATHRNSAQFAVKLLHPEISIREDVRKRFLREGYVANSVKHPGAVRVVDDDVAEDGAAFLVMDLLEGSTVEELCDRCGGRLPVRAAVAIVDQLLDVLSSAHANAIVHRDIKPANLFVTKEGSLKVLDFGIARARDVAASSLPGKQGGTGTGMLLGTPAFMAPEQALGKSSDIDAQTDLWAVGATVFTLLAGRPVHDGENGHQILIAAATKPARSLAEVAPATPASVVEVIDRALAFDKADRWATATAMRERMSAAWKSAAGEKPSQAALEAFFLEPAAVQSSGLGAAFAATRPGTPLDNAVPHLAAAVTPALQATPAHATQRSSGSDDPNRAGANAARLVTTARPVSSPAAQDDPPLLPKQRAPMIAAIMLAALVVTAGVGWAGWSLLAGAPSVNGQKAGAMDSSNAPVRVPSVPSSPKENPVVSAAASPPDPAPATASAAPPPLSAALPPTLKRSAGPASPPGVTVTSQSTPAAAPPPKPNCRVPFYVDSQGIQRIRPECR